MGQTHAWGWLLIGALCACRSIDIEPAGGGGAGSGGQLPVGAGGSGGAADGSGGMPACEKCGGEACVDLASDKQNCGECGEECSIGCGSGSCVISQLANVRDVDYDKETLYWVEDTAVWRSHLGGAHETMPLATRTYYDLEVENGRVYLTYANDPLQPPILVDWNVTPVEVEAECPADRHCGAVQVFAASDATVWTSPGGVYFRSTALTPASHPAILEPAFAVAKNSVGATYAYGDFASVHLLDFATSASRDIHGFQNPESITFAGSSLFAGETAGISCVPEDADERRLILDSGRATRVVSNANHVFALVYDGGNTAQKVVRIPASCGKPIGLQQAEVLASSAPCSLTGMAVDLAGQRLYWSQLGDTACAGVFSRRFSAEPLGTLADR